MTFKKKLRYFVHYKYLVNGVFQGAGRCEITRETPVCGIEDVLGMENAIKDLGTVPPDAKIMLTNWQRFEEPA